jgi:hypothetical protein
MSVHWDKELAQKIRDLGVHHEMAMQVVGLVADMRQHVYMQGYNRGYNFGYDDAVSKKQKKVLTEKF